MNHSVTDSCFPVNCLLYLVFCIPTSYTQKGEKQDNITFDTEKKNLHSTSSLQTGFQVEPAEKPSVAWGRKKGLLLPQVTLSSLCSPNFFFTHPGYHTCGCLPLDPNRLSPSRRLAYKPPHRRLHSLWNIPDKPPRRLLPAPDTPDT